MLNHCSVHVPVDALTIQFCKPLRTFMLRRSVFPRPAVLGGVVIEAFAIGGMGTKRREVLREGSWANLPVQDPQKDPQKGPNNGSHKGPQKGPKPRRN